MIQQRGVAAALLLLILVLALCLRFYRLDAQSLWNDEGTSIAIAQLDPASIAHNAALDIHPPLYYWLLSGWVRLFGTSETAVRSLSAFVGVLLVAFTFALGAGLWDRRVALAAALISAIHPFQIYYSQEARMYILLALLAAASALALARFVRGRSRLALVLLVLAETAGLYTHYSFIFVVLVLNLAFVLQLRRWQLSGDLGLWIASQAAIVLFYLPWLPTAVRQVRVWPSPAHSVGLWEALADTWRWIVLGPAIQTGQVILPLIVAAAAVLVGAVLLASTAWGSARSPRWSASLLFLWLGVPVLFIFLFGLYREAYLKFLLVTTSPFCLLLAGGLLSPPPNQALVGEGKDGIPQRRFPGLRFLWPAMRVAAATILLVGVVAALRNYYCDPSYARDDYRGIASYISSAGHPGDAVLLNAPGQRDVFGYYYQGDLPVWALPSSRPLDPADTQSDLEALSQPGGRVFAVLWATDESDPERYIEGWLDRHAFKAQDAWFGNVRLVVYAVPDEASPASADRAIALDVPLGAEDNGDEVTLVEYELVGDRFQAGDIAGYTLVWRADRTPTRRYKVFVHILDRENHIVGQRDAEPGGGAYLTTLWPPGEVIADSYGVPIHPATPPGEYAVEVGMYDMETGRRLVAPDGATRVLLQPLDLARPASPPPEEILGMQSAAGADLGAIELLGYSAHKLGFEHQPDVPIQAGDVLHLELFWRADDRPAGDWRVEVNLLAPDGTKAAGMGAEPVPGYSTSLWEPGDVWRGQFNLLIPVDAEPGEYRLEVQPLPAVGPSQDAVPLQPIRVQP